MARLLEFYDLGLSSVTFAHGSPVRRDLVRAPIARDFDFEDRSDHATLFYDCHWSAEGDSIVCIGPRLGTFEALVEQTRFVARPSGDVIDAEIGEVGTIAHVVLPVPQGTRDVRAETPHGTRIIVPQPNEQDLFRDKRVLLTMSLNNPLHWIRDWVWFYMKIHGTNAVLFYDNASSFYAKEDIRRALAPLPGLDVVVIPDWPFRYGAPNNALGKNDSRFSQRGMLEQSRHRFLQKAASVIQLDIDELVLPLGDRGLHEAAEVARTGYLQVEGGYIERVTDDGTLPTPQETTFGSWRYAEQRLRWTAPKWAVSPRRHAKKVFWTVHRIYGRKSSRKVAEEFSMRHVYGMKTPDTDARNPHRLANTPGQRPDPERHRLDTEYEACIAAAFDDPAYRALDPVPAFAEPQDPDTARIQAGVAARSGRLDRALDLADRAIAMAGDRPSYHEFRAHVLRRLGQVDAAAAAEKVGFDLRMSDPRNAAVMVRGASSDGDFEKALSLADQGLSLNPDDPDLILAKSEAHFWLKQDEAAAELADRALALGLDSMRLHWRRGLVHVRLGNHEIAREAYEGMRRLGMESASDWIHYYRGMVRVARAQGGAEAAAAMAREALERLDQLPDALEKHRTGFLQILQE